ncbi:MAG: hypothetical protein EOS10_00010 [Mesorhizobium sp.]|nr:MAG: hypothetical protein EOS10_00010 [Mesorhizobium sp.]
MVRVLLLIAVLNGISACTTTKGSFCQISEPIRLSSQAVNALSDAEVKTVLAHNRKGERLCRWKP